MNRTVTQPYCFTLAGPFRLSASAIDEYCGTDYFLVATGLLRRIASLPQPLGQSIQIGGAYSAGQIYAPSTPTIMRQNVLFGLIAEIILGIITIAPAFGTNDHRKLVFTLGKLL